MSHLKRTQLYNVHTAAGATMVDFGGWEMPMEYPAKIVAEHLYTRSHCSLFDVSHMGRILVDGTDLSAVSLGADAACVYIAQPNYYGNLEDARATGEAAHAAGARFIMGCNPIALAVMETPAACGADIAVGEAQPLGLDVAFGGPYLGYMAATKAMFRKLPGRIVGQTHDAEGNTGYVLTLTAREQHIRREKASSNICSNQALCAFTAGVYMTAMGADGLRQAAALCMSKAHYFAGELEKTGLPRAHTGEYFHEFVTKCDDPAKILRALDENGILGGLPVKDGILWCVTELVTKEELDRAVSIIKEVC